MKPTWTQGNGYDVVIATMSTQHIKNAIAMCKRSIPSIEKALGAMTTMDGVMNGSSFGATQIEIERADHEAVLTKFQTQLVDLEAELKTRENSQ